MEAKSDSKMEGLIRKVVKEMFSSELWIMSMVEGVIEKRVNEVLKKNHSISPKKAKASARNKKHLEDKKKS